MNSFGRNALIWLLVILLLVGVFNAFQGGTNPDRAANLTYSEFLLSVENGEISEVKMQGRDITGSYTNNQPFKTYMPEDPGLIDRLSERGVRFEVVPVDGGFLSGIFIAWFPMLLLIGVWIFFMRQMQGGGRGGALGFGKSKARLLTDTKGGITFDDVAGIDEAKEEVEEIIDFLKDPHKFQRLGGKIPKGALLIGPPGTGKTLLARAIAGEADVPFFTISGSDFVEMFVGVGASRVRDMFDQAKKNAPCIIFIDEIDAVGRHRGAGLGGGNDEREQTLNQLLVEMDGFETNEGVILIAATNRPDVLDPALLRPGRFDRQVVVALPDILGREKILEVHIRKVPLAADVNIRVVARGTPGFSGADLANLINEAALLAARMGKRVVSMNEFEHAKDKVMMGPERRSMVMSDEEKRNTAFHEAGHALVTVHCKAADPIHKATIIPRGRALGMVMRLPERDEYSTSRQKMHDNLTIAMGGRVAEEVVFGHDKVTSGATGDIQMATALARTMVTKYGLSDKLGPLRYEDNQDEVFLGHSVTRQHNISEDTAKLIDSEIREFIDRAYKRATEIITTHIDDLHKLANGLLDYETLTGEDIDAILAGKSLDREQADKDPDQSAKRGKVRSSVPAAGVAEGHKGKRGKDFGPEPQPEG